MGDVRVPYGDKAQDTAVLLLEAAEKAKQDPSVVRTESGAFVVSEEIAKKAKVDYIKDEEEQGEPEPSPHDPNSPTFGNPEAVQADKAASKSKE